MLDAGDGKGARIGSLTLAFPLRWRTDCAGVSGTLALRREPELDPLTLAFLLRWRVRDAGVRKGSQN